MSRAGWYRDPDDPTRFRHWDGRAWSGRHRAWPAWDLHALDLDAEAELDPAGGPVIEGPVRPAPLPATAARAGAADDAMVAWLHRPAGGARAGGGMRRGGARPPSLSTAWTPSRLPLVVFCLLVGAAVAVMAVSVSLARPRSATVGAVATDVSFVRAAGGACGTGLAPLRRSQSMSAGPESPWEVAVAAAADADAATATADALRQLRVRADAADAVGHWLAGWSNYAADQRALAGAEMSYPVTAGQAEGGSTPALGTPSAGSSSPAAGPAGAPAPGAATGTAPGSTSGTPAGTANGAAGATPSATSSTRPSPAAAALAGRVADDVITADQFALANGLAACRLGTDPSAGAVDVIP